MKVFVFVLLSFTVSAKATTTVPWTAVALERLQKSSWYDEEAADDVVRIYLDGLVNNANSTPKQWICSTENTADVCLEMLQKQRVIYFEILGKLAAHPSKIFDVDGQHKADWWAYTIDRLSEEYVGRLDRGENDLFNDLESGF